MDWEKLKAFYHIAQLGGVVKASKKMNLSQSALSRQVLMLEDRLQTKLFNREASGLRLNVEGKRLFDLVQKVFFQLNSMEKSFLEKKEEINATLKISTTRGLATSFGHHFKKFYAKHPNIELRILSTDSEPHYELYETDVAVRPFIPNQLNLHQEKLMTLHYKLYASKAYLKEFGTPKKAEDLDNHRLLSYGQHMHPFAKINWHLTAGAPEGVVRKAFICDNSNHNLCMYAQEDLGIVTLPTIHEKFHSMGNLVEILPDLRGPDIDIYFIVVDYLKDAPKVKAYHSFLKQIIA